MKKLIAALLTCTMLTAIADTGVHTEVHSEEEWVAERFLPGDVITTALSHLLENAAADDLLPVFVYWESIDGAQINRRVWELAYQEFGIDPKFLYSSIEYNDGATTRTAEDGDTFTLSQEEENRLIELSWAIGDRFYAEDNAAFTAEHITGCGLELLMIESDYYSSFLLTRAAPADILRLAEADRVIRLYAARETDDGFMPLVGRIKPPEIDTAIDILKHIVGLAELSGVQKIEYDFDKDGEITTNDAILVLKSVVGLYELGGDYAVGYAGFIRLLIENGFYFEEIQHTPQGLEGGRPYFDVLPDRVQLSCGALITVHEFDSNEQMELNASYVCSSTSISRPGWTVNMRFVSEANWYKHDTLILRYIGTDSVVRGFLDANFEPLFKKRTDCMPDCEWGCMWWKDNCDWAFRHFAA
jgi:hypothetical protein